MDIDSEWSAYDFSSTFPLPFRVLFLSFSTILAFATNLHFLYFIGIDTSLILDIRLEDFRINSSSSSTSASNDNTTFTTTNRLTTPFVHPSKLFPPIYKLAFVGLLWTTFGCLVFSTVTGGDPERMVKFRGIPAFVAITVLGATIAPWNVLYQKERFMFLRALKRIMFSPLHSAVPFSDIILADILTSSAKVLGDVWVSGCLLLSVTERFGIEETGTASGCARIWMVPVMTSLPYLFRFRQCLSEVATGSTPTPDKSIMNAIKYATAFPVILFSALQTVTGDPYYEAVEGDSTGWLGKDLVFTLWVLSVLVNSLYSFWWDVTNDWGLSLLTPTGWSSTPSVSYAFVQPTTSRSRQQSRTTQRGSRTLSTTAISQVLLASDFTSAPLPSRPHTPETRLNSPSKSYHVSNNSNSLPHGIPNRTSGTPSKAYSTSSSPNIAFPFLRPILLLPDPYIYYLVIAIDLILRLTWSLKLSSHLHSLQEIESGIFIMEALEVMRRWMWVFLRIEWEAVRKGAGGSLDTREGDSRLRMEDEELEMGDTSRSEMSYRDLELSNNNISGSGSTNSAGGSGHVNGSRSGSLSIKSGSFSEKGLTRSSSGNFKSSSGEIGLGIIGE